MENGEIERKGSFCSVMIFKTPKIKILFFLFLKPDRRTNVFEA